MDRSSRMHSSFSRSVRAILASVMMLVCAGEVWGTDYRVIKSGNWTTNTCWQYYDRSNSVWKDAFTSGLASKPYPGNSHDDSALFVGNNDFTVNISAGQTIEKLYINHNHNDSDRRVGLTSKAGTHTTFDFQSSNTIKTDNVYMGDYSIAGDSTDKSVEWKLTGGDGYAGIISVEKFYLISGLDYTINLTSKKYLNVTDFYLQDTEPVISGYPSRDNASETTLKFNGDSGNLNFTTLYLNSSVATTAEFHGTTTIGTFNINGTSTNKITFSTSPKITTLNVTQPSTIYFEKDVSNGDITTIDLGSTSSVIYFESSADLISTTITNADNAVFYFYNTGSSATTVKLPAFTAKEIHTAGLVSFEMNSAVTATSSFTVDATGSSTFNSAKKSEINISGTGSLTTELLEIFTITGSEEMTSLSSSTELNIGKSSAYNVLAVYSYAQITNNRSLNVAGGTLYHMPDSGTCSLGTVTFTGSSKVNGSFSYTSLNADFSSTGDSASITFGDGTTQTVAAFGTLKGYSTDKPLSLTSSSGTWKVTATTSPTASNFTNVTVSNSVNTGTNFLLTSASASILNGGNNVKWFEGSYVWTGASDTSWNTETNWDAGSVPKTDGTSEVTIPNGCTNWPVAASEINIKSLIIGDTDTDSLTDDDAKATFDLNTRNITVTTTYTNYGIVKVKRLNPYSGGSYSSPRQILSFPTGAAENGTWIFETDSSENTHFDKITNITFNKVIVNLNSNESKPRMYAKSPINAKEITINAPSSSTKGYLLLDQKIFDSLDKYYDPAIWTADNIYLSGDVYIETPTDPNVALTINGPVSYASASSLTADGNGSIIFNNSVTTFGVQTYNAAVYISDDVVLKGTDVTFNSTVNLTSGLTGKTLKVDGNAAFANGAGETNPLGGIWVTGTTSVGGNVYTTGSYSGSSDNGQYYEGAVTLTGNTTFYTTGKTVFANSIDADTNGPWTCTFGSDSDTTNLEIKYSIGSAHSGNIGDFTVYGTTKHSNEGNISTGASQDFKGAVTLSDKACTFKTASGSSITFESTLTGNDKNVTFGSSNDADTTVTFKGNVSGFSNLTNYYKTDIGAAISVSADSMYFNSGFSGTDANALTLSGNAEIYGVNTFSSLKIDNSSATAATTVKFEADKTQTFKTVWNSSEVYFSGNSYYPLTLTSTDTTKNWKAVFASKPVKENFSYVKIGYSTSVDVSGNANLLSLIPDDTYVNDVASTFTTLNWFQRTYYWTGETVTDANKGKWNDSNGNWKSAETGGETLPFPLNDGTAEIVIATASGCDDLDLADGVDFGSGAVTSISLKSLEVSSGKRLGIGGCKINASDSITIESSGTVATCGTQDSYPLTLNGSAITESSAAGTVHWKENSIIEYYGTADTSDNLYVYQADGVNYYKTLSVKKTSGTLSFENKVSAADIKTSETSQIIWFKKDVTVTAPDDYVYFNSTVKTGSDSDDEETITYSSTEKRSYFKNIYAAGKNKNLVIAEGSYNLFITGSTYESSLFKSITVNGYALDLDSDSNIKAESVTINGGLISNTAGGVIEVSSDLTVTGDISSGTCASEIKAGTGTVTFKGTALDLGSCTYTANSSGTDILKFAGSSAQTVTFNSSTAAVLHNVEIDSAASVSSGSEFSVTGSWNNSGAFTSTGTVTFNTSASHEINGTNSWNNLILLAKTDTETVYTFEAEKTQVIGGDFTVTGAAADKRTVLTSSDTAKKWYAVISAEKGTYSYAGVACSKSVTSASDTTVVNLNYEITEEGLKETADATTSGWFNRTYYWFGSNDNKWETAGNWSVTSDNSKVCSVYPSYSSGMTELIIQRNADGILTLENEIKIASMSVAAGCKVDFSGQAVNCDTIENNGTVRLTGAENLKNTAGTGTASLTNGMDSTVEYYGGTSVSPVTSAVWGTDYENLLLSGTTDFTGQIKVTGITTLNTAGDIILSNKANVFEDEITVTAAGLVSINADRTSSVMISAGAECTSLSAGSTDNLISEIDLKGTVTTTGPQSYYGAVILDADTTLLAGSDIVTFASTVDSAGGKTYALAVGNDSDSTNAVFGGIVGGTDSLSSLSVKGETTGATACGAVSTTGAQTYSGSADFNGAVTSLSASAVTFGGETSANALSVNGSLTTSAGKLSAAGSVTVSEDAVFGGEVELSGTASALTVSGTTALNGGTVTSTGTQSYNGAVTLGTDSVLLASSDTVSFGSTVDSASGKTFALAIGNDSEATNAVFGGDAGVSVSLSSLSVQGKTTGTEACGAVTTTGPQTYSGEADFNSAETTLTASQVTFGAAASTKQLSVNGNLTTSAEKLSAAGNVTVSKAAVFGGAVELSGTDSYLEVTGDTGVNGGTVVSSGMQTYSGAVSLGADAEFTGSELKFKETVTGSSRKLTVTSVSGGADFDGDVTAAGTTVTSAGSVNFNGKLTAAGTTVTADGDININGDITAAETVLTTAGNLFISGNASTASAVLSSTAAAGKIVLASGKTLQSAGTIDFKNTGILVLQEGSAVSADGNITQTGGQVQLASAVSSSTGKISFDNNAFVNGASSFTAKEGISFAKNLYLYAADKNITFNSDTEVKNNLAVFNGNLTLADGINLSTGDDLILLNGNQASMDNDSDSGVEGLFAYHNPARIAAPSNVTSRGLGSGAGSGNTNSSVSTAAPSLSDYPAELPDGSAMTTDHTAVFKTTFSGLKGQTITVNQNFYNNGVDMNGSAEWTLKVPVNDNSNDSFAELYNAQISYCKVVSLAADGYSVLAASEGTDGGNNSNVYFSRPVLLANNNSVEKLAENSGSYTVYDDVLRVEFVDSISGDSLKIENSNNEISAAMSVISGGGVTYTAFTDSECKNSTDGAGDISIFYLKAGGTWNTDADGTTAGSGKSYDFSGTHRTAVPYIDVPKAADGLWATLQDEHKNRIAHSTGDGKRITSIEDRCCPVLVKVRTGQELHRAPSDSQTDYDAHNFIEYEYSEAVSVSGVDAAATNVQAAQSLGGITDKGALNDGFTVAGLSEFAAGGVKTFISGTEEDVTVHSLYRNFAITAADAFSGTYENQTHRIRVGIAAYTDKTVSAGGKSYRSWPGYIDGAEAPSGNVTRLQNDGITDAAGNLLCYSSPDSAHSLPQLTVDSTDEELYGAWDNTAPGFAAYINYSGENVDSASEISGIHPEGQTYLSAMEFHVWDNGYEMDSIPEDSWFTQVGWQKNSDGAASGTFSADNSYAADIFGGARQFDSDKNRRTGGGVRYSTLWNKASFFSYATGIKQDTLSKNFADETISAGATSSMFFPADASTSNKNGTGSEDGLYFSVKFASGSNHSLKETFTVGFDEGAYVTDLAGNLLHSAKINTTDSVNPKFEITCAELNGNQIYVVFNKKIKTENISVTLDDGTVVTKNTDASLRFITIGADGTPAVQDDLTVTQDKVVFTNEHFTGILYNLSSPLTLYQLQNYYLQCYAPEKGIDPATGVAGVDVTFIQGTETGADSTFMAHGEAHAVSDFAVGAVDVAYAYDNRLSEEDGAAFAYDIYKEGSAAVHDWSEEQNNYGTLHPGYDITMDASVYTDDSGAEPVQTVTLFMDNTPDKNSLSTEYNADITNEGTVQAGIMAWRIWLPTAMSTLSADYNKDYYKQNIEAEENKLAVTVPAADVTDWVSGNQVSFLFGLNDGTGTALKICRTPSYNAEQGTYEVERTSPLYALRLKNAGDLTSLDLWSFRLQSMKTQRGGVTIANNVINASQGEKAVLQIDMPSEGNVNVMVMTIDGSIVQYLNHGKLSAGTHSFTWNGRTKSGKLCARGMYFVRITGSGIDETRKVMVVKD